MKEILYNFVKAINEKDINKIYSLMADDFIFFDSWGGKTIGKDTMKHGRLF